MVGVGVVSWERGDEVGYDGCYDDGSKHDTEIEFVVHQSKGLQVVLTK